MYEASTGYGLTGPKSSFVCATASALALFGAYESISISSSSRPIKATTTGMNVGNQATWALFTGLYSFGLLDLLLLCFSGNFCLSVWLACVYYCSVDAPCGCCSSSGTLIWLLVVALCLKLWVIGVRSCWLNVLLCLASNSMRLGELVASLFLRLQLAFICLFCQCLCSTVLGGVCVSPAFRL